MPAVCGDPCCIRRDLLLAAGAFFTMSVVAVQSMSLLRHDMGMGNTVTIWSQVCSGMGMGLALPNPCNTVPVPTVLRVGMGIPVLTFQSGEWSYDHVYSLTTVLNYHNTTNHCREQLLAGWKRGVRTVSEQPQRPKRRNRVIWVYGKFFFSFISFFVN